MKYLSITGARSEKELLRYLYTYAMPMAVGTSPGGRVYAVVEVPEDRAQYQADRMSSGMMGVSIHTTPFDAAIALIERL
jgi:hypothetical protein